MPRASPAQHSFAGGELSPLLEGRQDLAKYSIGCRRMRNFLPLIQGPARKRGGSRFLAEVINSNVRSWLYPFTFSETDAVVIEYGDLRHRFFTDRGTIDVSSPAAYNGATVYALHAFVTSVGIVYRSLQAGNVGNTPATSPLWWVAQTAYEMASPYAVADLINDEGSFGLSIAQSADVLYQAHSAYAPRTLTRTNNTSWAYAEHRPDDGPFDPQNIDDTIDVMVSASTGSVTFTNDAASIPLPETNSVGRLVRIEETDKSAIKPWEANKRIAAEMENPNGELRRSDRKVYQCVTDAVVGAGEIEFRTGSVKPIHTEGTEGDGDGEALYSGATLFAERVGVDWLFLHAGYGIGRVTAVAAGGVTATMDTLSRFPASMVNPGTSYRWSLGAWYPGNYPSSVAFFRDRLTWGYGQRVQLSVSASYTSHALDEFGETLADSAIDILISTGEVDQINWMIAQPDALLIGTGGGEVVLHEITSNQVFGPANNKFERKASYGSRKVAPLNVAEYTLMVQSGGRVIREVRYSTGEPLVAVDLTAFSEHITRSGIVDMEFAKNPGSLLWCVRADGLVACLTYQREEEVIAWSLHDFGGDVESVAVIPGPDSGIDDLYLIVKRTIGGVTKRYIEVLLPPYTEGDPHLSCYQDCSLTYDGAQAVTLTPGAGATVKGTEGVTFTAGSSVFVVGDVGRFIGVRTYDETTEVWGTSVAEITGYTSGTVVACTIHAAFAAGLIAANGWRLSATTISNLGHLEGETVQITADGATHIDRVVTSAAVTLTRPGFIVHVGKPVRGIVQLMNLEAGAADGTAQGKVKKINTITFRLFETLGGSFGPDTVTLDPIDYRYAADAMDQAVPLFSGDLTQDWNNGYETAGRITFVHDEGLPCTLCAIYPQLATEDHKPGGRY
jgi:hypothetical protein